MRNTNSKGKVFAFTNMVSYISPPAAYYKHKINLPENLIQLTHGLEIIIGIAYSISVRYLVPNCLYFKFCSLICITVLHSCINNELEFELILQLLHDNILQRLVKRYRSKDTWVKNICLLMSLFNFYRFRIKAVKESLYNFSLCNLSPKRSNKGLRWIFNI